MTDAQLIELSLNNYEVGNDLMDEFINELMEDEHYEYNYGQRGITVTRKSTDFESKKQFRLEESKANSAYEGSGSNLWQDLPL